MSVGRDGRPMGSTPGSFAGLEFLAKSDTWSDAAKSARGIQYAQCPFDRM